MSQKKQMVNASFGFNVVNKDGSERRYEAFQVYPAADFSPDEIQSLKENGVELYKYEQPEEAGDEECQ